MDVLVAWLLQKSVSRIGHSIVIKINLDVWITEDRNMLCGNLEPN